MLHPLTIETIMKNVLYFFLLFLSVATYGQKIPVMQEKIVGNEHRIDVYTATQNKAEVLNVSQIADDIEFLPLETTDECLLGNNIMNLVVTSKDIIIFDYEACYRFNRKGKFLNKIGVKGNGPGEYVKPMYVTVDTLNKWVYMGDYMVKRFVKYDYEGKHLADIKVDGVGMGNWLYKPGFILMESDFYQFAPKGKRYSLTMFSEKENRIISRMRCDYKEDVPRMAICKPIAYNHMNNTYVKDFFCDTIYKVVDPYHLESYAYVDKGDYKLPKKPTLREIMSFAIIEVQESDRYIILTTSKGRVYYDKKEKKVIGAGTLHQPKLLTARDDLYGGPGLEGLYVNGNNIYTFRYPHEFEEFGNGKHRITDARYDAYCKMVEGLNSEDNPVIMIVKLKK